MTMDLVIKSYKHYISRFANRKKLIRLQPFVTFYYKKMMFLFLFRSVLSADVCFSESTSNRCKQGTESYYDDTNISSFTFANRNQKITIYIQGNIKHVLELNNFDENLAEIEFYGVNSQENSIKLLISNFVKPNIILNTVKVELNTINTSIVSFSSLELTNSELTNNTFLNCSSIAFRDIKSLLNYYPTYKNLQCDTIYINIGEKFNFAGETLELDCDAIFFYNITNAYFGFTDNMIYLSETQDSRILHFKFKKSCTVTALIGENGGTVHFVNYYQYYEPFFKNIEIRALSGILVFDDCEWFSDRNFFNIFIIKASIYAATSIPGIIEISARMTFNILSENIKINEIHISDSIDFNADFPSNVEVELFIVDTQPIIEINDGIHFTIRNMVIKEPKQFYMTSDEISKFEINNLRCSHNFTGHFHIDISYLYISNEMHIYLPPTRDHNTSELHLNTIEVHGSFVIHYNKVFYKEGENAFIVKYEQQKYGQAEFHLSSMSSYTEANSMYLVADAYNDELMALHRFYAVKAKSKRSNTFCLGKDCDKNSTDVILSDDRRKNADWFTKYVGNDNSFTLKIYDELYTERNYINFYRLHDYDTIDLTVEGKKKNENAYNSFIFDGLIFYKFRKMDLKKVNCSIEHIRSNSKLTKVSLEDCYIDEVLKDTFMSVPSLTIDYITLKRISKNSFFKFNDDGIRHELTINCQNSMIYLYKDILCFNDINISCHLIILDAHGANITLKSMTQETLNYFVMLDGDVETCLLSGEFPSDLGIIFNPIPSSKPRVIVEKSYCPILFNLTNEVVLNLEANSKKVLIPILIITKNSSLSIEYKNSPSLDVFIDNLNLIDVPDFEMKTDNLTFMFKEIYYQGKTVYASQLSNYSRLILDQDYGANIIFDSEPKNPITIDIPFSITRLPYISLENGTYDNLTINLNPLSKDFINNSRKEYLRIKNDPYPYIKRIKLACGKSIKCENWKVNLNLEEYFWKVFYAKECEEFDDTKCYVVYLYEYYLIRYFTYYFVVFGSTSLVLVLSIVILTVRCIYSRSRRRKLRGARFSSISAELLSPI